MPGSSRPAFEPSICGCQVDDVELVGDLLQHADEDHGLAGRVLQVLERLDDLAAKQTVGATNVRLAGAVGERLRLLLGIGHHLPGQVGDAVDEDDRLRRAGILRRRCRHRRRVHAGDAARCTRRSDRPPDRARRSAPRDRGNPRSCGPGCWRPASPAPTSCRPRDRGRRSDRAAASSEARFCRHPVARRSQSRSCSARPTGVHRQ